MLDELQQNILIHSKNYLVGNTKDVAVPKRLCLPYNVSEWLKFSFFLDVNTTVTTLSRCRTRQGGTRVSTSCTRYN